MSTCSNGNVGSCLELEPHGHIALLLPSGCVLGRPSQCDFLSGISETATSLAWWYYVNGGWASGRYAGNPRVLVKA